MYIYTYSSNESVHIWSLISSKVNSILACIAPCVKPLLTKRQTQVFFSGAPNPPPWLTLALPFTKKNYAPPNYVLPFCPSLAQILKETQ